MIGLLALHEADASQHLGPVLHELRLLRLRGGRRLFVRRHVRAGRRENLVARYEHRLREVDGRVSLAHGDPEKVRTLGDLFVDEPLVLAPEDYGDGPLRGERDDVGREIARRLHMLAVEPLAGGRPDDGDAVCDSLFERRELLARVHYVGRVHGEPLALVPRILEVGGREPEMADPHVRHGAAARADVPRVERPHEDDSYVVQRIPLFFHFTAWGESCPSNISR